MRTGMKANAKVDAGICGFKTKVTAETKDVVLEITKAP